jgi:hypothetical protein
MIFYSNVVLMLILVHEQAAESVVNIEEGNKELALA